MPSSRLDPFLNSGVTLEIFHSFGKILAFIQLLKMYAKDGPTILLESFKSLQGILSNPVALFVSSWFKSLHTVLALGGLREKMVSVGCRWNSGSMVDGCISLAKFDPIVAKKSLKTSANGFVVYLNFGNFRILPYSREHRSSISVEYNHCQLLLNNQELNIILQECQC